MHPQLPEKGIDAMQTMMGYTGRVLSGQIPQLNGAEVLKRRQDYLDTLACNLAEHGHPLCAQRIADRADNVMTAPLWPTLVLDN